MKTPPRFGLCLLFLVALTAAAVGQEKAESTVTILVPEKGHEETVVKVNGKKLDGKGGERTYRAALEKGKELKLNVEALIEPNNYTKITRLKTVVVKGGEAANVDLRVKDPRTDKIVVRWVPTPDDIVDKMSEMAKIGKDDVVWDPGCGDAVMLIRPIKKFNAKKGVGIDIDPKMVKVAQDKAKTEGVADKVVIRQGDILNEKDMADIADATVVLLYIGDDLGARISPLLQKVCKPGTRIVSHRFSLGDWKPDKEQTIKGEDGDEYHLLYWEVKGKKGDNKEEKK